MATGKARGWMLGVGILLTLAPRMVWGQADPCALGVAAQFRATTWFAARSTRPAAVAVVIHGLNQRPGGMNPIVVALNNMNIDVLRLDLRGHGANYQADGPIPEARMRALQSIGADIWHEEARCAHAMARRRATALGVPVWLVGFSLGGLVGLELANTTGPHRVWDKMVLLAPAIRLRALAQTIRLLPVAGDLIVPSVSPPRERANQEGTPATAYAALIALVERLEPLQRQQINVPTLVMIDEEDELVDADAIRWLILTEALDQWRGATIHPTVAKRTYHHLITAPEYVGVPTWQAMVRAIRHHFLRPNPGWR